MYELRLIKPDPASALHADWRDHLCALAERSEAAFACEEAHLLRSLRGLLKEAPDGWALAGIERGSRKPFEALIAAGACNAAAIGLLGAESGYMLSRGPGGEHIASVLLPGRAVEATATGDSLALALVGALALALAAPRDAGTRTGSLFQLN